MRSYSGITVHIAFLLFCIIFSGEAQCLEGETRVCLDCHEKKGLILMLSDGQVIDVYVDAKKLQKSAHSKIACSGCHVGYTGSKHPGVVYRNKEHLKAYNSANCRRCHDEKQLGNKSIHNGMDGKEKGSVVCVDCHNAHCTQPIGGGKVFSDEKQYCMGCHSRELSMVFRNGERHSLKVDVPNSVHCKLACSDCHYGFSNEEHPKRSFKSKRDHNIALADGCRRCHFDKYVKTLEGVHYTMLSQGDLEAPVCTDCHGSHNISCINDKITIAEKCRACHRTQYEVFRKSVHGKALFEGFNQDVPVCSDCHRAHDIKNPLTMKFHEKIPDICGGCHADSEVVGRYGLSTNVLKTYLSDFHGVTLGLYKQQKTELLKPARPVAVCTDCHGNHNIASTLGPNSPGVKVNLVKMCRKCHANASENFPDAWLSHYEPSLAKAPMIFVVTQLYEIFIPIMVIGMALQIMLHAWRYIVNR